MPADIWVENVPFTETRNYIQQVMAYTTIFYQRLSREIIPLKKRMQDIGPE
jgi:soluble lytic murein transglycosylase